MRVSGGSGRMMAARNKLRTRAGLLKRRSGCGIKSSSRRSWKRLSWSEIARGSSGRSSGSSSQPHAWSARREKSFRLPAVRKEASAARQGMVRARLLQSLRGCSQAERRWRLQPGNSRIVFLAWGLSLYLSRTGQRVHENGYMRSLHRTCPDAWHCVVGL